MKEKSKSNQGATGSGSPVPEECVRAVQSLGFSELEASIYAVLLVESPVTGYRISEILGKPVANTYKGIQSLQAKGAVLVDNGSTRTVRAVPPDELMGQMESGFRQRRREVTEALAKLKPAQKDVRVYQLSTVDQVMERARQMIQNSRQVVLICAFPQPLEQLREDLDKSAERGVGINVKGYVPASIGGSELLLSSEADYFLNQFPAQELSLVVDAEQHLIAMFDPTMKNVLQGIWSGSLLLSSYQYNSLYNELILTRLTRLIAAGASTEELSGALERTYPLTQTPGFHNLLSSFQQGDHP